MNKIQITKSVKTPKVKIIGEYVSIIKGSFKNGNTRFAKAKIVQISPTGVYCNNDEFYNWDLF